MSEYICNTDTSCGLCEAYKDAQPIVRCRDCKHFAPKGYIWEPDEPENNAKHDSCIKFSDYDYEYLYMNWFEVEPDNFCCWAEPIEVDHD